MLRPPHPFGGVTTPPQTDCDVKENAKGQRPECDRFYVMSDPIYRPGQAKRLGNGCEPIAARPAWTGVTIEAIEISPCGKAYRDDLQESLRTKTFGLLCCATRVAHLKVSISPVLAGEDALGGHRKMIHFTICLFSETG